MQHHCPVCGCASSHQLCFRKWSFDIVRCRVCTLVETVLPEHLDLSEIYTAEYFNGSRKDGSAGYADYLGSETVLRREFRALVDQLLRYRAGGRLIEVGSAYGFFLQEAKRHFEVVGVEASDAAREFSRKQGLTVLDRVTHEALASLGSFDVAVMLDVIEHLPQPFETLSILAAHLSDGAHVVISTGDVESVLSRVMGSRWRLMTPPQHVYFFSRRTLTSLLARAGFRVIAFSRPAKRVPLGLVLFQMGCMIGIRIAPPKFVNNLFLRLNLFDAMRVVAVKDRALVPVVPGIASSK